MQSSSNNFDSLLKRFYHGLGWNMIETVIYQLLLNAHLVALYYYLPLSFYGQIGMLFGFIYLAVGIGTNGFEQLISRFLPIIKQERASFYRIGIVVLAQMGIAFTGASFFAYFSPISSWWLLSALIIALETARRSVRTILQLFFYNRLTTLVELSALGLYLLLVWGAIVRGTSITIATFLLPLALQSALSLFLLIPSVVSLYTKAAAQPSSLSWGSIIMTRLKLGYNQCLRLPFSNNALVYFLGLLYGTVIAGQLKFVASLCTITTVIIEHAVGLPSLALLAHLKESHHINRTNALRIIIQVFYIIIGTIVLFGLLHAPRFLQICTAHGLEEWHLAFGIIVLLVQENIITLLEKIGLLEDIFNQLAWHNVLSALVWCILLATVYWYMLPPQLLLLTMIVIRSCVLGAHLLSLQQSTAVSFAVMPRISYVLSAVALLTLLTAIIPYIIVFFSCRTAL